MSIQDKINILKSALGSDRLKLEEKLTYYTFSKSEGIAECFYIATKQAELIDALDTAHQLKVLITVLGGGTKMLISPKGCKGLVIKNRAENIKVSGIKGKVGRDGIGVEEALVECESGTTVKKLNDFLKGQKLQPIECSSSMYSSIGGSLFLDMELKRLCQKIKVWERGDVFDIQPNQLKRINNIVISAIFKVKASNGH